MASDEWGGILQPGEDILWQGRPDHSFHLTFKHIARGLFGVGFAAFALFWMIGVSHGGGIIWMFGLIHFAAGVGVMIQGLVWPTLRLRHTFYTLTTQNAFIATDIPYTKRTLTAQPITATTSVRLSGDTLSTIWFEPSPSAHQNPEDQSALGFERIAEGHEVMRLIRTIQSPAT